MNLILYPSLMITVGYPSASTVSKRKFGQLLQGQFEISHLPLHTSQKLSEIWQNLYYSLSLHLVYLQNNHTIPDRKCQVLMYLRVRDSFITSFDLNPIVFRTHAISIFKYFWKSKRIAVSDLFTDFLNRQIRCAQQTTPLLQSVCKQIFLRRNM